MLKCNIVGQNVIVIIVIVSNSAKHAFSRKISTQNSHTSPDFFVKPENIYSIKMVNSRNLLYYLKIWWT